MFTIIMLEAYPFNENISCGYIEYKLANMNSIIIKNPFYISSV